MVSFFAVFVPSSTFSAQIAVHSMTDWIPNTATRVLATVPSAPSGEDIWVMSKNR